MTNHAAFESDQEAVRREVLAKALAMGAKHGWYDLSLFELAEECGTTVNDLRRLFPDTNAIADAWFASALEDMLAPMPEDSEEWTVRKRLDFVLWRWLEVLARYHGVTVEMLKTKLHPPHIHHWAPMPFDLSRLVQLWRDAAGLHSGGRRRQLEEISLTAIFLATLVDWCRDCSSGQTWTHQRLGHRLERAERAAGSWFGPS
jgi:AcrR family transcriptional regulator